MRHVLLESITETEADGYYFGQFKSMDPITLMGTLDDPICLIHRMELERARNEGRFKEVYELVEYQDKAEQRFGSRSKPAAMAVLIEELAYPTLTLPHHYPVAYYEELTKLGVKVEIEHGDLFPERWLKSTKEIEGCREGARISEAGFARVREILSASEIGSDNTLSYKGEVLTCETLRREIRVATSAVGGGTNSPIAASGLQAADCHCIGFGPVKAHEMIVVDIFPRDDDSFYFGDLSRTFIKGQPSEKQQHIYDTVYASHLAALAELGPGKKLGAVDKASRKVLDDAGYPTRQREDGKWEGCYCGIGHGVGLDVHEPPSLRDHDRLMEPGHVITIEPGLYLPEHGGCRIEDTVVITKEGWEFINTPTYDWVIA
ncbi:aminopeptidase P family protein [Akkermansiaceae bacterium]|nr:aminopeptidase P family protein [Akkermansiaceae bacterium]MDB4468945.1 aminopeptidase P family protein [Akkermansiaceae bacterium]MDB4697604.1 aminopeptidase P family protein [Akkermansiaceae bacterium]MDC0326376.1 aminopeptidase P family protein [bacterium]